MCSMYVSDMLIFCIRPVRLMLNYDRTVKLVSFWLIKIVVFLASQKTDTLCFLCVFLITLLRC